MGMYTELLLKCEIREDISEVERGVVDYLFGDGTHDMPKEIPDDEFFQRTDWTFIGNMSSYYHTPFSVRRIKESYLFMRCDLKNYTGTIESFLDWFCPLVDEVPGVCIGWYWYEENERPRLILLQEDGWKLSDEQ